MPTVQDFLRELENETPSTRRALERVPKDKLDWAPNERSLTMGQLALHIANIPGALSEIAMKPSFDVSFVVPRPTPASVEQVLTTLDEIRQTRSCIAGAGTAIIP